MDQLSNVFHPDFEKEAKKFPCELTDTLRARKLRKINCSVVNHTMFPGFKHECPF